MHIGIVSDTHSRYHTIEDALEVLQERQVETLLHCGDIEDADAVQQFRGFQAHFVLGNCDGERASLGQAIHDIGGTLHGAWGQLELEGVKLAFLHGDDQRLMHDVEHSGRFDYLFYGHTHRAAEHRIGPTRVINPGALHRARPRTFVILDLASGALESVVVD